MIFTKIIKTGLFYSKFYVWINAFQNNREEKSTENCWPTTPSKSIGKNRGSSWENKKIVDFNQRICFVRSFISLPAIVKTPWSFLSQSSYKVWRGQQDLRGRSRCRYIVPLSLLDPGRRLELSGRDLHRAEGCHSLPLWVANQVLHKIIGSKETLTIYIFYKLYLYETLHVFSNTSSLDFLIFFIHMCILSSWKL